MPKTSDEAYRSISGEEISRLQASILRLLEREAMTDEQLIDAVTVDLGQYVSEASVRTRRSELVGMGKVKDSGETRPSRSGRRMIVWSISHVEAVKSGMRPNAAPGRPDRFVNMELARAQAAEADTRQMIADREDARLRDMEQRRATPWLPRPPRVTFGQVVCRWCSATGGNKADGPCAVCHGEGVL